MWLKAQLRAAESKLLTAEARIVSARAGVKRAQAGYARWESEYKRLDQLVTQLVLDVQVRDETYRQFEEAAAIRDQADALVTETTSDRDMAIANRDKARVDVEAARADLEVARADEREARVNVEYGQIKSPYPGVITQRNVSPGDYLQPGGGSNGRPLFVLEQTDPVRVFVGVPELASSFIHDGDKALIHFQALWGSTREGKVVRSGYSLNPSTRTLQTEVDIPNSDDHLHPGWYVTVSITIDRKQVWTLPSNAIGLQGQRNYVYLQVNGKPVRTPVIIGPSDDTHTEVAQKYSPVGNTNSWPRFDRHRNCPGGQPRRPCRAGGDDRGGRSALKDHLAVTKQRPFQHFRDRDSSARPPRRALSLRRLGQLRTQTPLPQRSRNHREMARRCGAAAAWAGRTRYRPDEPTAAGLTGASRSRS